MRNLLSLSVLASIILFGSCKKKDVAPTNMANVMFVHGVTVGSTPINIDGRINDAAISGASNISFLKNSGYISVNVASGAKVSFMVNGGAQLSAGSADLAASAFYTAFAGGYVQSPSFLITTDDLSAPATGKAKVRFVNLCADNLNTASCYVGTVKLDSNIGYLHYTPFYSVTATSAKVAMVDQYVLSNSAQINSQQLAAGKIYTFMLTGTSTGAGTSALTLTAITR